MSSSSRRSGGSSRNQEDPLRSRGGLRMSTNPPQVVQRGVIITPTVTAYKVLGSSQSSEAEVAGFAVASLCDVTGMAYQQQFIQGYQSSSSIEQEQNSGGGSSSAGSRVALTFRFPDLVVNMYGTHTLKITQYRLRTNGLEFENVASVCTSRFRVV